MNTAAAALPDDAPHLLVVDDDRRIRNLLSRFLVAEGYRVTTAETAADARAKLEGLHWAVLEQDRVVLENMAPDARSREFLYQHDTGLARLRRALEQKAQAQLEAMDKAGAPAQPQHAPAA